MTTLTELSERLLQLSNDEGTAQIHDIALEIARLAAARVASEEKDLPALGKVIEALKTGHPYLGPDKVDVAAAAWLERLSAHPLPTVAPEGIARDPKLAALRPDLAHPLPAVAAREVADPQVVDPINVLAGRLLEDAANYLDTLYERHRIGVTQRGMDTGKLRWASDAILALQQPQAAGDGK